MNRRQNKHATEAAKGLMDFTNKNPITAKIAASTSLTDKFRKIYNVCCPRCQILIQQSGGRAAMGEYCENCQTKIKPILQEINQHLITK